MDWEREDEARVGVALGFGRDELLATWGHSYPDRNPKGHEIVYATLYWAHRVDSNRRLANVRPAEFKGSSWAAWLLRTQEEYADAFRQRMSEINAGDDPDKVFGFNTQPSAIEVSIMESVQLVFRECLMGRTQARDWRMIHLLLRGKKWTESTIGKEFHVSRQTVSDAKIRQCMAIWRAVGHLMPPVPVTRVLREAS